MKDKYLSQLKKIYLSLPSFLRKPIDDIMYRQSINKAFNLFLTEEERKDSRLLNKLRKDIQHCRATYSTKANEYFLFGFRTLTPEQRNEFLPDWVKDTVLNRMVGHDVYSRELRDKYNFYRLLGKYFKRDVMLLPSGGGDYALFEKFALKNQQLFMKRNSSSRGRGIRCCEVQTKEDARKVWETLAKDGDDWIIEEKIIQVPETAQWNQSSVNTVRLPAIFNNEKFTVLGPFLRTGRAGAIADNAGAGGIFACIDPKTGVITTDGIDENGIYYEKHPNSSFRYKGWQVPKWKELLDYAEQIHKEVPHHKYVGWDFALSEKGWMLVEGNWGQFVSQYNDHIGLKKQFFELLGVTIS
jgi:hypothetical protein